MEAEAVIALIGEDELSGLVAGLLGSDLSMCDGSVAAFAVATALGGWVDPGWVDGQGVVLLREESVSP